MPTDVWNLKDLLPEHKGPTFDKLLDTINQKVGMFEQKRLLLKDSISSEDFTALLSELEDIEHSLTKVAAYGELWFSEDTSHDEARAFSAKVEQFSTEVANKTLFFSVWWKQANDETAQRILASAGKNRYFLEHMRKLREHALQENEEKIINLKDTTGSSALTTIYDTFTSTLRFPIVVEGKRKKATQSELTTFFHNPHPAVRENAYKSLLKVYINQRSVIGEIYTSVVRDWYNEGMTLRKYTSPINVRNKSNDLPDEAIEIMLETVREHRSLFNEFFKLKGKLLGLEMTRYHIYAPLRSDVEKKVSFDEGKKIVLDTFNAFSPEIAVLAKKIFDTQHVHSVLGKFKRSGAFCYGIAPKEVPYVLLNYNETMDDVITMAHELGHAVHDQLAGEQTIFGYHPPLPLAETASVFGELMVTHQLLERETNPEIKKHLIAAKLDDLYATIGRQAYFILFEKKAHELVQKGATIGDLAKEYYKQLKEQFEDLPVPKKFAYEWLYIPHIFHTPFYCYAYSFGNLLTLALYQMYREEGTSFIPKYVKLLSYGGSENPEVILQELGIDIKKKEFWEKGFQVIKEMVDEFKRL